ncbi:hypothetical protein H0H81_009736 [Sphagnurus paluster]|uniref:Uncharacterized protein n=1 Tax=Sphagnurus paluster TaxID=117069 RepID=A0A9P7K4H3_9AGAR|nr:hypothetical protein H0H81_009736 [Sphagnurus paluster]
MASSRASSPLNDAGSGLSAEELAERELLEMMSSNPTQPEEDDETDQLASDLDTPAASLVAPAASLRNELVYARQKATQLKLHPYQRDAVDEFVKSASVTKQILLFIQLCAVENMVVGIKTAAPPFVSSPQLLENIKSFVVAVLLSPRLSAYKKDSVPVGYVMSILTGRPRSYVPENLLSDSFALKIVKRDVQEELTQTRARIKKAIKDSVDMSPSKSQSIFDLASNIVANSKCSVNVPLCTRIALLRKVYVESPGTQYWDKVDTRLLLVRTTAG